MEKEILNLNSDIHKFIEMNVDSEFSITKASEDASFRKYYRVQDKDKTSILMVAPPDKEPLDQFLFLAKSLKDRSARAPKVYAFDHELGVILQEDFGTFSLMQYYQEHDNENNQLIFSKLNETIIHLQKRCSDIHLPIYSSKILIDELSLFQEWYLKGLDFKQNKLEEIYSFLLINIEKQNKKFVHRDFHCRNLLIHDDQICLIDFQDALIGPITYDLVSFLKDAYHKKKDFQIMDVCIKFWELARSNFDVPTDFGDFFIDFEMMGVQRHLKILGIFKRLYLRDGKNQYLNDIPLVENYVLEVAEKYPKLSYLKDLIFQKRQVQI
ncbi:phosphotransferase [Methylophilaceae bacterium]|nr:phosphotransferase [Methylophilaceae bacterium]